MGKKRKEPKTVTKATKATKATKPTKPLSSTNIAMQAIVDNPEATEENIQTALKKAGARPLSSGTIDYLLKEVKYIVGYLKESGRLK